MAAAVQAAGHDVRIRDLRIFRHADYRREVDDFAPDAAASSRSYLANVPEVLDLAEALPGVVTRDGAGPTLLESLDLHLPARDLSRRRRKYFIGMLDACASAELTRGGP